MGADTIFLELRLFVLALIPAHQLTQRPGGCLTVSLRPPQADVVFSEEGESIFAEDNAML